VRRNSFSEAIRVLVRDSEPPCPRVPLFSSGAPTLEVGLVDASVVVLANRHDTRDVLTLDELHFRHLPADAGRL
jgi:hypothetical protein